MSTHLAVFKGTVRRMQKQPEASSRGATSLVGGEAVHHAAEHSFEPGSLGLEDLPNPASSHFTSPQKAASLITGPGPVWLGLGLVLAGIGTVLLGPLLPTLSTAWNLSDAKGGILLAAKFSGAFLGGFGVLRKLGLSLLLGAILCATGFGSFGFAGGLLTGSLALFVGGLGLGQMIASTNILVGRRYAPNSASALSLLNFFWSLGAVMTGLLVAGLLPRFGLRNPLLAFAALFLVVALGGAFAKSTSRMQAKEAEEGANEGRSLSQQQFLHFASLLFLYGGLETSLSGWLTTYTVRFSDVHWLSGQSAVVLLWTALTLGRAISSGLMRWFREVHVRAAGLGLALLAIAALTTSSRAASHLFWCVLLGLGLAPFFPATFARLMRHQPKARMAGLILAVSGIGAALFPWLVGLVSAYTGSLRVAMVIPLLLTLALMLVGAFEPRPILGIEPTIPGTFSTSLHGEDLEKIV